MNQNIKIFKIIDLDLEACTFERLGELLLLNENCSNYEIHAGMFIVCFSRIQIYVGLIIANILLNSHKEKPLNLNIDNKKEIFLNSETIDKTISSNSIE